MLISTKGRYALRVLVDMAEHQAEGCIPLREIAARQDISEKYLEILIRELVKQDIVTGSRGKGGGYRLTEAPEKINAGEVLKVMEGTLAPVACLEDNAKTCAKMSECRTLNFWKGLDEAIYKYTSSYSIADLMRKGEAGNDFVI